VHYGRDFINLEGVGENFREHYFRIISHFVVQRTSTMRQLSTTELNMRDDEMETPRRPRAIHKSVGNLHAARPPSALKYRNLVDTIR